MVNGLGFRVYSLSACTLENVLQSVSKQGLHMLAWCQKSRLLTLSRITAPICKLTADIHKYVIHINVHTCVYIYMCTCTYTHAILYIGRHISNTGAVLGTFVVRGGITCRGSEIASVLCNEEGLNIIRRNHMHNVLNADVSSAAS